MAKLSDDKQYVTVESGDSLWKIAKTYLGAGKKYQTLVTINAITDPNKLCVGQKIYLYKKTAPSTNKKKEVNSNVAIVTAFGLQSNTDNVLYAAWQWSKSKTESYAVEWTYATGDGIWFVGSSGTNAIDENNPALARQSTYSIPDNAKQVRFRVKPISKKKSNKSETNEWNAKWTSYKTYTISETVSAPEMPDVKIENYKLTMSLENINIIGATKIEFQIYKDDKSYANVKSSITATNSASASRNVEAGGRYKVRCRAIKGKLASEWSNFSSEVTTIPAATSKITTCKGLTETSVYLEWSKNNNAKTYDIQYTTKRSYFDGSDQATIISDIEVTHYDILGLESGSEYFFRVRAVNDEGASEWSDIKSVILGGKPSAPTTWSSTTTCITGDTLTLYWIHNSTDGSNQTYSELEIVADGTKKVHSLKGSGSFHINESDSSSPVEEFKDDPSTDEDESVKTNYCTVDTSRYKEGASIQWRVRTAGITKSYGDWSVQRTVDIYAPPTLDLSMTDVKGDAIEVLTSFPFYIRAIPGPATQTPTSFHVSIIANESYETVDDIGNKEIISEGDEVYSQYFDVSSSLLIELMPSSINLDNNINYTVKCIVSMDSGLTAESTLDFTVAWTDEIYEPNAEIGYDKDLYATHVRPYCMEYRTVYRKIEYTSGSYVLTEETVDGTALDEVYTETEEIVYVGIRQNGLETYYCAVYVDENENMIDPIYYAVNYSSGAYRITTEVLDISTITPARTITGEEVLMGITEAGDEIRYAIFEENVYVEDVTLSVYRREFDGSFVEIASGLNNTSHTYVTDPHPALDYARYRIVAVSNSTGAVSYYDVPGYPIGEIGVIIQWDETWSNLVTDNTDETFEPSWSGSVLKLLYNIDVADSNDPDVAHVEYVGRKHPVTYYGTQLGTKQSWNLEIEATDKETLYTLRRLMNWMGDVYVREPSGSGYWANIKVTFSQKHRALTIPVTFDITRVEGGI